MDRPDPSRPDLTYDGTGSAEVMEGGLGQLTDGHEGGDDITSKSRRVGKFAPVHVGSTLLLEVVCCDSSACSVFVRALECAKLVCIVLHAAKQTMI